MLSKGTSIIGIAAAVALVCFFLPWLLVSCGDEPVAEFTGWQLAAGGEIQGGFPTEQTEGSPELFLVLLAAAGCLVLVFFAYQRRVAIRMVAYVSFGLAGLTLLVLLAKFAGFESRAAEAGVTAKLQAGLWGTVLANAGIIVGGVLDLMEGKGQVGTDEEPSSD